MGFFTSQTGMLKLFQLLLGSCCETLLLKFGLKSSGDIGQGMKFKKLAKFTIFKVFAFFSISWISNNSKHMLNHHISADGLLFCFSQNRRSCEIVIICKTFIFNLIFTTKKEMLLVRHVKSFQKKIHIYTFLIKSLKGVIHKLS